MRAPAVLSGVLLVLAAGCVSGSGGGFGDPQHLAEEEIRAAPAANAYELVERLRPRWLREAAPRSLRLQTVILVYYDGVRLGTVEVLRDLRPEVIRGMRLLDSSEAGRLPGLGSQHVDRVILVVSTAGR